MKKTITALLALSFIAANSQQAEAVSSKPSDLKVGHKDYNAVVKKDVRVFHPNAYRDNKKIFSKIKAGQSVTVTEHRLEHGYNYLILKGNKYVAVDDAAIQIKQPLKSDIRYSTDYKITPQADKYLKQAKGKKYYNEYKQYINNVDREYFKFFKGKDEQLVMNLTGVDVAVTEEALEFYNYDNWLKFAKGSADSVIKKPVKEKQRIDILSSTFKKNYFNNENSKVLGRQPGDSRGKANTSFMVNNYMMTDLGKAQIGRNAGYIPNDNMKGIKDIIVVPYPKVSYQQIINVYGKPSSTEMLRKYRVEHHLIYEKDGYDVIVALDSYKGNVKYIYKKHQDVVNQ